MDFHVSNKQRSCPVSTCPGFDVMLNTDADFKAIIDSHNSLKKRENPNLICTVDGCLKKDEGFVFKDQSAQSTHW
jgi:hypothetical protein